MNLARLNPEARLYQLPVPVIGLTGGIATGKSTVGRLLQKLGLPVLNADLLVKEVYALPETLEHVRAHYPDVFEGAELRFPLLRTKVFSDPLVKADIEALVYKRLPEVFQKEFKKLSDPQVLIYDVPLLFEKKLEALFDATILVYAPVAVQRIRLMARDGISEELSQSIIDQQMGIEEKKLKADWIVDNSKTEQELTEEVETLFRQRFS